MKRYVIGFMFDLELNYVLLIRKGRPLWQLGRLNGVGGHIEEKESPYQAMIREFEEETGIKTTLSGWVYFGQMKGTNDSGEGSFTADLFCTIGDPHQYSNVTDEQLEIVKISEIGLKREDMIENLPWLIGLALDNLNDSRPSFVEVLY